MKLLSGGEHQVSEASRWRVEQRAVAKRRISGAKINGANFAKPLVPILVENLVAIQLHAVALPAEPSLALKLYGDGGAKSAESENALTKLPRENG